MQLCLVDLATCGVNSRRCRISGLSVEAFLDAWEGRVVDGRILI